jgi:ElaB/YqjD/DUF883 family membrane-anchored ribosome-binding protein
MSGANAMAQSTYSGNPDQVSDIKEKAAEQFGRVGERAERMAGRMAGEGREVGQRMQEVASNFKGALDKSVRDQPMATIASAAIIGFVLGALWKS